MTNLIAIRLSRDLGTIAQARLNKAQKAALAQVLRDCKTLLDERRQADAEREEAERQRLLIRHLASQRRAS